MDRHSMGHTGFPFLNIIALQQCLSTGGTISGQGDTRPRHQWYIRKKTNNPPRGKSFVLPYDPLFNLQMNVETGDAVERSVGQKILEVAGKLHRLGGGDENIIGNLLKVSVHGVGGAGGEVDDPLRNLCMYAVSYTHL